MLVVYVPSPTPDRQKVLQHHPDKQDQDSLEGDDHFKCIKIGESSMCVCVCMFVFMLSSLLNMQHMTSCRCRSVAVPMTVLTPHSRTLFLHPPPTQGKTSLRCLDLSLRRTVDGPPGSLCQHWGTPTPVWRRWRHFMTSGRCQMFV